MAYVCWDHGFIYKTKEQLTYHEKRECAKMLATPNVCTYMRNSGKCCRGKFASMTSLILHYKDEHNKYACSTCYMAFDTAKELEAHKHTESDLNLRQKPYKCPECNTSYATEKGKNAHITSGHRNQNQVREAQQPKEFCVICKRGYVNMSSLYRHMRKDHGITDPKVNIKIFGKEVISFIRIAAWTCQWQFKWGGRLKRGRAREQFT